MQLSKNDGGLIAFNFIEISKNVNCCESESRQYGQFSPLLLF